MTSGGPLSSEGLVQLLDHTGARVKDPQFESYLEDLTVDQLRSMWRDMVLVRAFDTEATSLQRQGELGLWVPSLGQEAAQIGSGYVLRGDDYVFPSYREHGVALTRGVDLPQILTIFRGLRHGAWDPREHNFHLYTLVIGAHTLHATGYAMALDRDGLTGSGDPAKDAAVVAYFGDGATSQGDVNEAMVFASVNNAPVVFFCQNNQFAISEPTTRQSTVPLAQRGSGFGIPSVRVDGNDVLASYAVSQWALQHARSGGGPVLIEAFTYRMGAHTTSDDPSKYRSKADEEYWAQRDPIARFHTFLTAEGLLPEDYQAEVHEQAKQLATRTRTEVRSWQRPPLVDMFDHAYAQPHASVDAERAWLEQYERSFVDSEVQS